MSGDQKKGAHKAAPAPTTPDAPELAVAEKPAPDTSPAPAATYQPRPRRIAHRAHLEN